MIKKEKLILETTVFKHKLGSREYPQDVTGVARLESGEILRKCTSSSTGWLRLDLSKHSDVLNYEIVDKIDETASILIAKWIDENEYEIAEFALKRLRAFEVQALRRFGLTI